MAENKEAIKEDEEKDEKIDSEESEDESGEETTEEKDEKKDEDAGEEDQEEEDQGEEEEEEVEKDFKPPVRKSVEQHIITRQKKTIEKLRSKQEEDDDGEGDDTEDDDELGEYDKTARKVIGKEVQKQLNPLIKTLASKADEEELKDLFESEPESKKYEKKIRVYMQHPSWAEVPPSAIFHHLAFRAAQGTDKKKKAADKEADLNKGGGSGRRVTKSQSKIPTVEEMDEMDDAEFDQLQHEVKIGKFKEEK